MDATEQPLELDIQANSSDFAQMYDATYDRIFGYVLRRCNDYELALDLTSETYLKAVRNLHQYKPQAGTPFIAWLYRIASNEVNMYFRKMNKYKWVALEDYPELKMKETQAYPGQQIDHHHAYTQLHAVLITLEPIDQTIVTLRYFEEKSITEISLIVEKKEGTVKSRLSRALRKLRAHLQPEILASII